MLNLYLIKRLKPDWEEIDAMLVYATSESHARWLARTEHANRSWAESFLDPERSTCGLVTLDKARIVLESWTGA